MGPIWNTKAGNSLMDLSQIVTDRQNKPDDQRRGRERERKRGRERERMKLRFATATMRRRIKCIIIADRCFATRCSCMIRQRDC